jgi:hypothetical protein
MAVAASRVAQLGADHPDTLNVKSHLAVLYWRMKKLDRSIPLFEEMLQQWKQKLGPGHPDTLRALANLGVNFCDAGRLDDGLRCLEEATAAIRQHPGYVPQLAWIPGKLAQTFDQAKRYAEAEPLYREFLERGRRNYGAADLRTADLTDQLAQNLLAQKKHAEAESLLRDGLAVRAKDRPDDWLTFKARSMLGEALLGQKKYAEAEPLLKAGYLGLKERQGKIPPASQTRLTEALERLVRLYEATGRPEEAARWRKELEAARPAAKAAGR